MIAALLQEEQTRHETRRGEILASLKEVIANLPDNPRVKRFQGNPKAFTIRWGDLQSDWSVEHHDFRWCYNKVSEIIFASSDPAAKLHEIVKARKIVIGGRFSRYTVKLHPDVVRHLAEI